MADEADDVLELDDSEALAPDDTDEDEQPDGTDDADSDEEDLIGFGEQSSDGAAPAPESESSVIRDLRRANRELAKKLHAQERGTQPQRIEVGEKPTLASCEYDEDQFEEKLDAWKARKAEADKAETESQERQKATAKEWQDRAEAYTQAKARIRVPDYEAAEDEVFSALSDQQQALILMTGEKSAALVYALSKDPAKLEQLSKLDPVRSAMFVGKLEDKVTVIARRKVPQPDTPLRGNAALSGGSADRELARLEKEAERTGVRTKLIQYRKQLAQRAS